MDNLQTPAPTPTMWRPLGFGEILDRAITQYVKNFLPFVGIVLILTIPYAILQYFIQTLEPRSSSFFEQLQKSTGSATTPFTFPPWVEAVFKTPGGIAAFISVVVVSVLVFSALQLLVNNAVAIGVARIYSGKSVGVRICYDAVLRRWEQLLALLGIIVAIVFGLVLAVGLLIGLSYLTGGLALILVIPVFIVLGFSAPVIQASLTFAMYAVVIEEVDWSAAIASGFRRAFSAYWRIWGMLFCTSLIASIGGGAIGLIASLAIYYGQLAVGSVISAIGQTLVIPFTVIVMAVIYYDIRIRREGLDIEASVEHLTAGETTPA